jgi:hypothetical protein
MVADERGDSMRKRNGAFLASVRRHFGDLFRAHRMEEMEVKWGGLSLTAGNEALYVELFWDQRDYFVEATVGRLVDGGVPQGVPYLDPGRSGDAPAIPVKKIAMLATGRRAETALLGKVGSGSAEDVDAAVARLADALARYGGDILSDVNEWVRVGRQMMTALAILRATTDRLTEAFLGSVRERFGELLAGHGFVEREMFYSSTAFAWVHLESDSLFMRIHCEFEDRLVNASLGRLIDGSLPPDWWEDPKTEAHVKRIPTAVIAWLATGDRDVSLQLGSYAEDSEEAIVAAVTEVADALERYGSRFLAGDPAAWERAVTLEMARRRNR